MPKEINKVLLHFPHEKKQETQLKQKQALVLLNQDVFLMPLLKECFYTKRKGKEKTHYGF
jgi:hypothetical protein